MKKQYQLIKDYLQAGGFGTLGLSGLINPHIKGVERVSDTEVRWTVENAYGESYTVTVTATIPSQDKTRRTQPQITIAKAVS